MKLIDKSALVAEIKTRIETYNKGYANGDDCRADALETFLHDLDTLEVKEVDLEKEIKEQSDKYYSQCEKKLQEMNDNDKDLSFLSLDNFAKYFFELGMQVSNKTQKGEEV